MLERDDPGWKALSHAYGSAGDIPELLNALDACDPLPARWQEEPLSSLLQALCHQRGTYDASYAAAPHLISIAAQKDPAQRTAVLHLAGSIFAYQEHGVALPDSLRPAYEASRTRGIGVVEATLTATRPAVLRNGLLLLADLAACRGPAALARAIMCMESGELDVKCDCGRREILGVFDAEIEITPIRWRRRPTPGAEERATRGLSAYAGSLGLLACERVLAELGGSIECDGCGSELDLLRGIAQAGCGG